jgi:hypothetical protein
MLRPLRTNTICYFKSYYYKLHSLVCLFFCTLFSTDFIMQPLRGVKCVLCLDWHQDCCSSLNTNLVSHYQCCGSGSKIRCLFGPWTRDPGWVKIQDPNPGSGSGMNNLVHISESLEPFFWVKILKFFDADPGSRMEKCEIRDPRWKNSDPGSGSATLATTNTKTK